jgi:penicillin-binding protein 1C
LASAGTAQPLIERASPTARAQRLLDPVAAFYVGQILLGTPPPDMAPRGRIAFKTGTSYGYRDAWAIGFDGKMTIGVWAGRPDGVPVAGLTGRGVAAPILFDAFARLGWPIAPRDAAPAGALVMSSLKLPKPLQRFRPGSAALADDPPRIMFPPDGASLEATDAAQPGPFAMKISGGAGPLTVLVNGVPVPAQSGRKTVFFEPDGRGFVRLTVMDSRGAADSVTVRIQ